MLPSFHKLVWLIFFIWPILVNIQWHYDVSLMLNLLMTNEDKQPFISLFVIETYPCYKTPIQAFLPFTCLLVKVLYIFCRGLVWHVYCKSLLSLCGLPLVQVFIFNFVYGCGYIWTWIMSLQLPICGNSDKLIKLPKPQFPICKTGIMIPA